ncbi:MAG TPA: transporter [Sphingomicrobium sp.]|nr:transporter [Sphingomicrobium sp.]
MREIKALVKAGAFFFAGIALLSSTAARADAICAARPGKSTPACTVPAGHFQVEAALADWSLQRASGERDTLLVIGETTFKYGATDRSDIEIDVTPWQRTTSKTGALRDRASGIGDVTVAYKRQLTAPDGDVQLALLPVVKIPTAKHSLGNGKWEAGLLVPIGFSIANSPISIGLTPELDWTADADGHGHHAAMAQVVSLGWQLTGKLSLSGGLWGQWDWDPTGTGRQASADGSIAYLLSDDVQLDAGASFGLKRRTPDLELYTGISKRF